MVPDSDPASHRSPRAVHLAWAALAILVSVALAVVPGGGHPPPIVLLPVVLVLWATGHVVIWALAWLHRRGQGSALPVRGRPGRWPPAFLVTLLGSGAAAGAGLLQLLGSVLQRRWYPYPDPWLWTGSLLVCSLHAACLAGLLLRRPWSRTLGAILALGWAALTGSQLLEHASANLATAEGLLAIGLVALFVALALNLLTSRRVKRFFER